MRGWARIWKVCVLVLMPLLAAAPASLAGEATDPRDAVSTVTDAAGEAAGEVSKDDGAASMSAAAPPVPGEPTADDDRGAHETSDPSGPDHAAGSVLDVDVAGGDAVDLGATDSQVDDDGNASGDVTVLAVGGNEIVGASSDSQSGPENDTVAPIDPLCEGSGGGVCVGLLFADTTSTDSGGSSSAESDAALAFACLGGSDPDSDTSCDGVVSLGLATSSSEVTQDNESGETTAQQETAVADACVGGEDQAGVCEGLGASVLAAQSESEAPSDDGPGNTMSSSCVADIEAGGSGQCVLERPEALELPPGCPAGESLLCLYVNQGEAFVFTGGAGSRQETLHVSLLPGAVDGSDLLRVHVADAETLATNPGAADGQPPAVSPGGAGGGPDPVTAPATGQLAFTGVDMFGLLAALGLLAAASALMLAFDRAGAVRPR